MDDHSGPECKATPGCACTGHCSECGACACGDGVQTATTTLCNRCLEASQTPEQKVAAIRTAAAKRGFTLGV